MQPIAIDYETYYDKEVSIKPLGVDGYINHPEAVPYLVSIYTEDLETEEVLISYCGPLEEAPWDELKGQQAIAHNARFDETVHLKHLGGLIPADCVPAKWSCTADLAVYLSAPRSLLGASKQLLRADISKGYRDTVKGKQWDELTKAEKKEVADAGIQDAQYCFWLWKHFNKHWPKQEQMVSQINREMGRRGIAVNTPKLEEAIEHVERELWTAGQTIPWEWGGKISKTPLSRKKIAEQCRKDHIPCPSSFAQDSEEAQEWEEEYALKFPWIESLKTWRYGSGFLSKLKTIRDRTTPEGNFQFTLKYFGAHTGRMSGDGGFNMQNMYRDERFGYNLRHFFIPRPGHKFYIADYEQIEARLLIWVVWVALGRPKQGPVWETLQLIRSGLSVYEVHAIQTMGYVHDPKVKMKEADPKLYHLAKARVLALGYACGHVKFQYMAFVLCGLELDLPTCKKVVDDFRANNKDICRHWQKLHSGMLATCRTKTRTYKLKLPSGRSLEYFNVNPDEGMKAQVERGGNAFYFYGGKLCENEIQAIGRDVLVDAMVACWEILPQYPMVLDVHDELVFEVPEGIDEAELRRIDELMVTSSPWADELPLAVEGGLEDMYVKG
jgi:DNA polymerase I-like protein with 3'-5' exonuclease and polymerase domains